MASNIGIGGQALVDGRDISTGLSAFRATFVQGTVDTTRLRAPSRYRTFGATLDGGSVGFTGDLPDDDADALIHAADFLKRDKLPRTVLLAPFGADVGKLAFIGKALRTSTELSTEIEAVLGLNAEFQVTAGSPGIMPGLTLFSPNLDGGSLTQNEMADLVFTNTDPNQFFALRAAGTTQTFGFQAGVTNAALEAGIEALPAYAGRQVTVTGAALTGTTTKSGSKRIEFDGATDVPALELLQGVLHVLTLNGATGTKRIYGTVDVNVSTSTAASVQTDVRAKLGEFANVVVSKSGSGGSAVYTFAYPLGAAPADLVQPIVQSSNLGATSTITDNGISALYTGEPAERLFDGQINAATLFPDINASKVAVRLDFGSPKRVSLVRIYVTDYSESPSFEVDTPENGRVLMATVPISGAANRWIDIPITYETPVQTVGFFNGTGALYISEIEVYEYGASSGPGPDPTATVSVLNGGDATTVAYFLVQQGGSFSGVNIVSAPTSGTTVRDIAANQTTNAGMLVCLQNLMAIVGASTWKLQHAPDNNGSPGTWVDLLSFAVDEVGAYIQEVPKGVTIYPNTRMRCTAITGSARVAVAAARRF